MLTCHSNFKFVIGGGPQPLAMDGTVTASPAGSIICSPSTPRECIGTFAAGSTVTLTFVPLPGARISSWLSFDAPLTISADLSTVSFVMPEGGMLVAVYIVPS